MCTYDDANVCFIFFMHARLLGGRCLGRRCKVLLKDPGTLCGGCVCQRAIAAKKTIAFTSALISNVSIIILSCPSTQFYLFINVAFLLC